MSQTAGGWKIVNLGAVISHRKEFIDIDDTAKYNRCRVQLHAKGIVLRDEVEGITIKTKKQQVCKAGEFLVAEIDAKVGGFGIVPPELNGAIVSSHYFLYTLNPEKIERAFLDYFVRTPFFRDQVQAQGSTNYAAIRPQQVLDYEIPLPPLSEQRRIVAKIERLEGKVEEAIGLRDDTAQSIEAFRSAAFKAIFESSKFSAANDTPVSETLSVLKQEKLELVKSKATRKPDPIPFILDEEIPFILPRQSTWIRLESICHSVNDGTHQTPTYTDCGRIFLSAQNVKPYKFIIDTHRCISQNDYETYVAKVKPEIGDILMTRVGAGIGETALIDKPIDFAIYVSLCLIKPLKSFINRNFLVHWLNSPYGVRAAKERTLGRGFSQGNLNLGFIRHLVIPFPPVEEQRRIAAALDDLQRKIDQMKDLHRKTASAYEAMLPSILDRAFRGEL
jgi:type I restriction enzyme, S subunit